MYLILLLAMLFCHIVDDYYLQGVLGQLKQRQWWIQNAPDAIYENDYKVALMEHALSWTCCIHIPIAAHIAYCGWSYDEIAFLIVFVVDWLIHAVVDDLKANKHKINLMQDQAIHIIQVIVTWIIYYWRVM